MKNVRTPLPNDDQSTLANSVEKEKEMFTLTIDGDRDWRNAISSAERTGEELKTHQVVRSLISRTDFSNDTIAELVRVSVDFVKKIRGKG